MPLSLLLLLEKGLLLLFCHILLLLGIHLIKKLLGQLIHLNSLHLLLLLLKLLKLAYLLQLAKLLQLLLIILDFSLDLMRLNASRRELQLFLGTYLYL